MSSRRRYDSDEEDRYSSRKRPYSRREYDRDRSRSPDRRDRRDRRRSRSREDRAPRFEDRWRGKADEQNLPGTVSRIRLRLGQRTDSLQVQREIDREKEYMEGFLEKLNIYAAVRLLIPNECHSKVKDIQREIEKENDTKIVSPHSATMERNVFIIPRDKESKSSDKNNPSSEKKDLPTRLSNCVNKIAEVIAPGIRGKYNRAIDDNKVEIRLLVSGYVLNYLDAKFISTLRSMTGCSVMLFKVKAPESTDRILHIYGAPDALFNCVLAVNYQLLVENQTQTLRTADLYDANNAQVTITSYGGYRATTGLARSKVAPRLERDGAKINIRLIFPITYMGGMIGKAGCNINETKERFNVKVGIHKEENGFEAIVNITSKDNADNHNSAIQALKKIVMDSHRGIDRMTGDQQTDEQVEEKEVDMRLLLNEFRIELVKNSSLIDPEKLMERFETKITLYDVNAPASNDKVVQVTGICSAVIDTLSTITRVVLKVPLNCGAKNYSGIFVPDIVQTNKEYGGFNVYGNDSLPEPRYSKQGGVTQNNRGNTRGGGNFQNNNRGGYNQGYNQGGYNKWQQGGYNQNYNQQQQDGWGGMGGAGGGNVDAGANDINSMISNIKATTNDKEFKANKAWGGLNIG